MRNVSESSSQIGSKMGSVRTRVSSCVLLSSLLLLPVSFSTLAALAAESSPSFQELQDASASSEALRIETFKTHSRIVVRVEEHVQNEWKNTAEGFEILLKGVGFMDLGAPLGEEAAWKSRLESLSDPRIASLKLLETGGNLKILGKWKYPTGSNAPATPRMEAFEYRDKNPSQLIVDLWLKKGPTVAEMKASKRQAELLAEMKRTEADARARAERRLASLQRKAEIEDLGRFCRQPLSESTDIFLPFLPFHEPVNFSRWMATTTPDDHFVYFEPKAKDRDAQYVRLALELYRQGKPALVNRTLEFHEAEHPKSPYRQEMNFLKANALIKVGMEVEAEQLLSRLMADAKNTAVALHSGMYLAAKRAHKGGGLNALEPFLWLISNYPENRLAWLFHLGSAEIYAGMKQLERAAKEYQWVMEFAPEPRHKAEAAARVGDLYLGKLQHEQALASYSEGLRYFGKELEAFPSIHVNRAEVLYQLGQYDRAKPAFEEFLKKFPGHPAGWRAAYRLGEMAGRQGDPKARDWYYETINRFPFSPGATLARLRLVTCGDHGGFTVASGEKFFQNEAQSFDGKGDVVMTRYRELKGLARVRALIAWGQDDQAVEAAVAEIDSNRGTDIRPALNSMLSVLYRRRIQGLLAQGKKYEAIAFFQEKSRYLPEEAKLTEPDYLLALSRAAADLGMGKVAGDLNESFRKATAGGRAPAGSQSSEANSPVAEEGRPSAPRLPIEDIEYQLRLSEERFTQAKALWVAHGKHSDGQNEAQTAARIATKIQELLSGVREESPFSYEREIILGLMAEAKGRFHQARAHAMKAQLLQPIQAQGSSRASGRIDAWLAALEARTGDPKAALEMYRKLEASEKTRKDDAWAAAAALGVPPVPTREALIFAQAGILEKEGRWGEAASAYSRALDGGAGGNQAVYGLARALLRTGKTPERAKGMELLEKLAQDSDPAAKPRAQPTQSEENRAPAATVPTAVREMDLFWKKLAMETLANEKSRETNSRNQSVNHAKEGKK